MKIETHLKHDGCYFVSDDDNEFITELNTNSWDDFERSIDNLIKLHKRILLKKKKIFKKFFDRFSTTKYISGQTCAAEFASYFINHPRREFYNLIPFVYFWTLKSGYIETVQDYETRIFPHIAHKISIAEGRRWLFAYDSMIEPDDRVEFYTEWMKEEQAVTQHDRIERLIALHGLLVNAKKMSPRSRERVCVMYLDFVKQEENRDIEKVYGEIIEADFKSIKKSKVAKDIAKKENDIKWSLDNWLMRRYALKEVFGFAKFWSIITISLITYISLICGAFLINENTMPIKIGSPFFLFIPIFIFVLSWWKGGWRLSKIIWGTAIGWFFVFSAVLADLIYQRFPDERPQLLELKGWEELVITLLLFGGIVFLIISREMKEAEIKPRSKKLKRLVSIGIFSVFFGLLEGSTLIALISWYFSSISCWFNRWALMILTLGTIQAVAIGVITQLIWESRRLTEIVRK